MSLWTTRAHAADNPFADLRGLTVAALLATIREADPTGEHLRAAIAANRAEAERPLSQPLTAAALHTPIGARR